MKALFLIPIFVVLSNGYIIAPLQNPISDDSWDSLVFIDNNNILYSIQSSYFYIYDLSKYSYITTVPLNISLSINSYFYGIIQNKIFLINFEYPKIIYIFETTSYNSKSFELPCNQIDYDDSKIYCIQDSPYIYDYYSLVIYDVLNDELNTIKLPDSEYIFKNIYKNILVINDTIYFFDRCFTVGGDWECYFAMYNFNTFEYSSTDQEFYLNMFMYNFNNKVYFNDFYYDPLTNKFYGIDLFSSGYEIICLFSNKIILRVYQGIDQYIFDINSKTMTQITSDYYNDKYRSFFCKGSYPFTYIGNNYAATQQGEVSNFFYRTLNLLISPDNSVSPSCNNGGIIVNNKCNCAPNFAGDTCNECSFPNFSDKCYSPSECNITNGKLNWGKEGDGKCACFPNWEGNNCDECVDGFYLPDCLPCPNCNNGTCNPNDGTCICYLGYYGKYCNDSGYKPVTPNSTDSGYNDEPFVGIPTIGIVVLSITFPTLFLSMLLYQRIKSLKSRNIVISIPSIFGISLVTSDAYRKF